MNPLLAILLAAASAFALAGPALAQQQGTQQPGTMTEREYCDALAATYRRYLGQSSARSQFPDVTAANAIADCERGRAASAIPVLEQKLRNAGFSLPVREAPLFRY